MRVDCIGEDTQEMPQPRSTVLPRHQKKEIRGENFITANATYTTTDAHTKKQWNRLGTVSRKPSRYTTLKQRRFNIVQSVKTTSIQRSIDVVSHNVDSTFWR